MSATRVDVVWLIAGSTAFVLSGAAAMSGLAPGEEALFTAINSLPDQLMYVIWPFMQYGVFLTIPVLSAIAMALRRFRLALTMLTAGVSVYLLARIAKGIVDRGRPEALIADVEARETFAQGSVGFPSGHVAVAAALTVVVTPYLRGRWRYVPAALLIIVAIGRMYVAAHTPLDLVGGAGLGAAAGALANVVGRRDKGEHLLDPALREDPIA